MIRIGSILMVLMMTAGQASAQRPVVTTAPPNLPPPMPHRVDQTVADINPLSTSQRVMKPEFRQPSGFFDVMQVPGRPDLLMRANGEVYAVFPRSEYVAVRGGIMPLIPANTIFYIGTPPSAESIATSFPPSKNERSTQATNVALATRRQSALNARPAGQRVEDRSSGRVAASTPPLAEDPDAPDKHMYYEVEGPVTIVTDSSYRLWRLQELLQRAAKAEQAGAGSTSQPAAAGK